jgi:signal transduction histidine kinase
VLQVLQRSEPKLFPTQRWWTSPRAFKLLLGAFAALILTSTLYTSMLISERQRAFSEVSRYNVTWAISQAGLEVARFEAVLAEYALAHATPGQARPDGSPSAGSQSAGSQSADSQSADPSQAQIRFDIVASRVQVLGQGDAGELIRGHPDLLAIFNQLRAATASAEPLMDQLDHPDIALRVIALFRPLNQPMARLASAAHDASGTLVGQDLQQLSQLHWVFSGMLIALIACCVVLISVLVLHNRALSRAHVEVAELVSDLRGTGSKLEIANEETRRAVEEVEQQNRILRERDSEVAQQNSRFDAALNNMRQALCMVGPDDRLIVCNLQFLQLFGVQRSVARTGLPASRLFDEIATGGRLDADLARRIWQEQQRLAAQGQHAAFTRELAHGQTIAVSHQPMDDGGWVATYEDVTDSRLAERRLTQAQKMEAIGNLTGGMAHDFNNLLAVITLNLEFLLGRTTDTANVTEPANRALQAAIRGADLISQLLAFARRQPLAPTVISVNKWIRSVGGLLERMLGEDVMIRLELGTGIWPVSADATRLETAIVNLATNARDAMNNGGRLTITTRNVTLDLHQADARQDVRPGDYVMIEVQDTGTGMSPEIAARVFEPFFTTKDEGHGTGLGLSMVFGFIRQSGGHIVVDSVLGRGTIFRLHLPRCDGVEEPEADALPPLTDAVGGRETILLVEDNEAVRGITTDILQGFGYDVIPTANAYHALTILLGDQPVDLLLSDVVMPGGLDGFALIRHASQLRPDLPVLLASGFVDQAEQNPGIRVLAKPYRQADLARAVREILDGPSGGG